MRARSVTRPQDRRSFLGAPIVPMSTAPLLLILGPTLDPTLRPRIAVVHVGHSWTVVATTLAMHFAAPLLLAKAPTGLPIQVAECTIVWVNWAKWSCFWKYSGARDESTCATSIYLVLAPLNLPILETHLALIRNAPQSLQCHRVIIQR